KPRGRSEDPRHRASGSTDIQAAADCSFALERTEDGANIEQTKNRESDEHPPFAVVMVGRDDGPVTFHRTEQRALKITGLLDQPKTWEAAFLESRSGDTLRAAAIDAALRSSGLRFSSKSLGRALKALLTEGVASSPFQGGYRFKKPGD